MSRDLSTEAVAVRALGGAAALFISVSLSEQGTGGVVSLVTLVLFMGGLYLFARYGPEALNRAHLWVHTRGYEAREPLRPTSLLRDLAVGRRIRDVFAVGGVLLALQVLSDEVVSSSCAHAYYEAGAASRFTFCGLLYSQYAVMTSFGLALVLVAVAVVVERVVSRADHEEAGA